MITNKPMDSYDEIKGMLNRIRKIQATPQYGMIGEQIDSYASNGDMPDPEIQQTQNTDQPKAAEGGEDLAVINNVEVKIHSEDPEDLTLEDDEKQKISQLIDDFRKEVSELAEFEKLDLYPESGKLTGSIGDINLGFTFSAGDDNGFYLNNATMLKIDAASLDIINRLTRFQAKFANTINDFLVNRRDM